MPSSRGVKRASSAGSSCSTIRFWARGPRHSGESFIWCVDGITRNNSPDSAKARQGKSAERGRSFLHPIVPLLHLFSAIFIINRSWLPEPGLAGFFLHVFGFLLSVFHSFL